MSHPSNPLQEKIQQLRAILCRLEKLRKQTPKRSQRIEDMYQTAQQQLRLLCKQQVLTHLWQQPQIHSNSTSSKPSRLKELLWSRIKQVVEHDEINLIEFLHLLSTFDTYIRASASPSYKSQNINSAYDKLNNIYEGQFGSLSISENRMEQLKSLTCGFEQIINNSKMHNALVNHINTNENTNTKFITAQRVSKSCYNITAAMYRFFTFFAKQDYSNDKSVSSNVIVPMKYLCFEIKIRQLSISFIQNKDFVSAHMLHIQPFDPKTIAYFCEKDNFIIASFLIKYSTSMTDVIQYAQKHCDQTIANKIIAIDNKFTFEKNVKSIPKRYHDYMHSGVERFLNWNHKKSRESQCKLIEYIASDICATMDATIGSLIYIQSTINCEKQFFSCYLYKTINQVLSDKYSLPMTISQRKYFLRCFRDYISEHYFLDNSPVAHIETVLKSMPITQQDIRQLKDQIRNANSQEKINKILENAKKDGHLRVLNFN